MQLTPRRDGMAVESTSTFGYTILAKKWKSSLRTMGRVFPLRSHNVCLSLSRRASAEAWDSAFGSAANLFTEMVGAFGGIPPQLSGHASSSVCRGERVKTCD